MFCPLCHAYVTEYDLIKFNAQFLPGRSLPVEYEASCPACMKRIGRVSWGQLIVDPSLPAADPVQIPSLQAEADAPAGEAPSFSEDPAPVTEASAESPVSFEKPDPEIPAEAPGVKLCPHCGLPLPEGF